MADDKKGKYPRIARNVWFGLREKLKQKVPAEISASYVAGIFQMEPASATVNVLPALRTFGLIDEGNKPTDLAFDWRDDSKYGEVCAAIIEDVYPRELRDLYHSPDAPLADVRAWFSRNARVGDAAASKFAITYLMLLAADLSKATSPAQKTKSSTPRQATAGVAKEERSTRGKSTAAAAPAPRRHGGSGGASDGGRTNVGLSSNLHIAIQIHISPDSSPEQIEKIFESMGKHLRDFQD